MTATAKKALDVAISQIGYVESAGNRTKYGAWYGTNGVPWCAMFTSWVMAEAGLAPGTEYPHTNWVPSVVSWGKRELAEIPADQAQPGDLVAFALGTLGRIRYNHVGIVEEVTSTGSLLTIEGNTDVAGGRTGGRVMRKIRRLDGYSKPNKYIRPDYSLESEQPPPLDLNMGRFIMAPAFYKGDNSKDVWLVNYGPDRWMRNGDTFKRWQDHLNARAAANGEPPVPYYVISEDDMVAIRPASSAVPL